MRSMFLIIKMTDFQIEWVKLVVKISTKFQRGYIFMITMTVIHMILIIKWTDVQIHWVEFVNYVDCC